ncbi:MAG: hypothetical protein HQL58_04730 [Magnetococcales bacterium]|nr:hypothetical protein [Magnetococcales bacterium]
MSSHVDPLLEKSLEKCLDIIAPLFVDVRTHNRGMIPRELLSNNYVLGFVKGMMNVLLGRCGVIAERDRGMAILEVCARTFDCDSHTIGERLVNLHLEKDDLDYLEGINDGSDYLVGLTEGRREEVTYRLMNRLEPYIKF